MKRGARVLGCCVAVALVAVWLNKSGSFATVTHRVGAPDQTVEVTPIDLTQPPIVRFAVAGDVGTGGEAEYRTAAAMDAQEELAPFDALLLLGDNVYENGDPELVPERVYAPFADVLDGGTRLISVLGNHDVRRGNGPAQAEALAMPALWYSTLVGDTLILALDSTQPDNEEQLAWLEAELAAERPRWTIVMMHHPAFSAGWHGSDAAVQDNFVPLIRRFGVDLVLSGHDHDYQRSNQIDGGTYVVTGAAAKLRRTGRADFTAVSWSTYSFVVLDVYQEHIVGQAVDQDGRAIDSFELR